MKHSALCCLCLLLLSTFFTLKAQEAYLLPKPRQVVFSGEPFKIKKVHLSSPVLLPQLEAFITGQGGEITEKAPTRIEVRLVDELQGVELNKDEAYRLAVNKSRILIEAIGEKGVYWALQTLRQLCRKNHNVTAIRGCEILDWPAFRIRGFMQDVGRGYIPVEELKREIDILSRYKINVFHFHLTENQSWRLESKIFPMLNDSCNSTRMPGKYYTSEEAKDLVKFCKQRQVLLLPEIDMPGHSAAFVRTFRHDMQSEEGIKILKLLIDEVCETFDVPYLHIGTDEVGFTNPRFVPEMVAYVRSKGKKAISWNPGWNYNPGEIDMTHLWSYRGKAQSGIPAIDSRFHYLNHFDIFGDIIALYNSRIYNQDQGSDDVAGGIMAVWQDRLVTPVENVIRENGFYPHMLAFAERLWLGGGTEYFDKNGTILPNEDTEAFKDFSDFEQRMLWHKKHNFQSYPFPYVKQTNIRWNITDAFPNNGDLDKSFPPETEEKDCYLYEGKNYYVRPASGAGIYLRHVWGTLVPSFFKNPEENHTAYAYTWVYSPKEQKAGMWIEFQNYSRSEKDLPPPAGKWDYKGSRIWLNNQEIFPPAWTADHTQPDNEIALGNENFTARPPIEATLHKGWNKVFLKLPVGKFTTPQVRLVKWMFTVAFVTPNGKESVEGLIYSRDNPFP